MSTTNKVGKTYIPACRKCGAEKPEMIQWLNHVGFYYQCYYYCHKCFNRTPNRDSMQECYQDVDWKDYELRSDDAQADAND